MNYIEFDMRKTMTKKDWLALQKANRVMNGFNTGERVFASKKKPSRKKAKRNFQKELDRFLAE